MDTSLKTKIKKKKPTQTKKTPQTYLILFLLVQEG